MQLATCSWVCNEGSSMIQRWHIGGTESWSARRTWWRILRLKVLKLCWKRSKEHAKRQNMPKVMRTSAGLKSHHAAQSHITQCNCEMGEVTSYSGKSHHFVTIPQAQRHLTENRKVSQFSRDIAHSEIFHDFYKQVCNEYQWHSVCLIWPFDAVWFEWFEFECRLMWESPWTPKPCSDCPTFKAPTVSRCSATHDCESPEIRLMVTLTLDSSLAIVQNGGAPESGPLSHSATLRGQKVFQNIQLKNIKKTLCIIWRSLILAPTLGMAEVETSQLRAGSILSAACHYVLKYGGIIFGSIRPPYSLPGQHKRHRRHHPEHSSEALHSATTRCHERPGEHATMLSLSRCDNCCDSKREGIHLKLTWEASSLSSPDFILRY